MLSPVNQTTPSTPSAWLLQNSQDWLDHVETPASAKTSNRNSEITLAFLRRVLSDDRLRQELEADPQAALARCGIHVAPESLPATVTLPSNEALRMALRIHCGEESEAGLIKHLGFFGGLSA